MNLITKKIHLLGLLLLLHGSYALSMEKDGKNTQQLKKNTWNNKINDLRKEKKQNKKLKFYCDRTYKTVGILGISWLLYTQNNPSFSIKDDTRYLVSALALGIIGIGSFFGSQYYYGKKTALRETIKNEKTYSIKYKINKTETPNPEK